MTAVVNIERAQDPYTVQIVSVEGGQERVLAELKAGEKMQHLAVWQGRDILIREVKPT